MIKYTLSIPNFFVGLLRKALELSFNSQQFDTLQDIAADLNKSSDPELVKECAEYFVNNEQYEKAVDLLAIANKVSRIISILSLYCLHIREKGKFFNKAYTNFRYNM